MCLIAARRNVQRSPLIGQQQTVPGRIGEHDAVGCIAMLANEIEERGEVSRKQQWAPTVDRTLARMLLLPRTTALIFSVVECPLLAQSRHR